MVNESKMNLKIIEDSMYTSNIFKYRDIKNMINL